MHASAMNSIVEYFALFEGGSKTNQITWMYLDELALVSTGVGILLDPLESNKFKVQFYKKTPDGGASDAPATDFEVKTEFALVKSKSTSDASGRLRPMPEFKDYKAFEPITNLRIKSAGSDSSALKMIQANEKYIKGQCPDFDDWPADVQVAIIQMGYAGGLPTRLSEGLLPLLKARDWYAARSYTYLSNPASGRNGYLKQNKSIEMLMLNGWIIDSCRKLGTEMVHPAPKDHTIFYGLSNRLFVARWNQEAMTPEIRKDDIITGGDVKKWLNDWFIRTFRELAKHK